MELPYALQPASEEKVKERKEICKQCEHYSVVLCKKCNCILEAKIRLDCAVCPLEKWGTYI